MKRVRRLALVALLLDLGAMTSAVIVFDNVPTVAVAAAATLVGSATFACWNPRLGLILVPVRGFVAIVLLIGGLVSALLYAAAAATVVALAIGSAAAVDARSVDAPPAGSCTRCHVFTSERVRVGLFRRRLVCARCARRADEVGSAVIHMGLASVVIVGAGLSGGVRTGLVMLAAWPMLVWGWVGIHEAGHALAARAVGARVTRVELGAGLQIFRVGPVRLLATPVAGKTEWLANGTRMTSRREIIAVAGGPLANLLAAMVAALAGAATGSTLAFVSAGIHGFLTVANLVPMPGSIHGLGVPSDGARLIGLLRGAK